MTHLRQGAVAPAIRVERAPRRPVLASTNALPAGGRRLAAILIFPFTVAAFSAAPPAATPVAAQSSPVAGTSVAGDAIEITGLVQNPGPITVSEPQGLPSETVEVSYESGGTPETHTFTGVRLIDVLNDVGLAVDPEARNPSLRLYLVVTAKDGYQVVLSGGELDPNFGDAPMLLAWEQDGEPLSAEDGPVRLVSPGDLRGGRYVWGIVGIDVRTIDEAA